MALTTELHPYQKEDIQRCIDRGSMLIAYEMGLGKTVMTLAILESLFASGTIKRSVIVVPASLKWQWAKAIATHTDSPGYPFKGMQVPPHSRCAVIDGSKQIRICDYVNLDETDPRYIIMSYENMVQDWAYVSKLRPDAIILDEVTFIKNFKAARTKIAKKFKASYRFALSGQPIESRPDELFSIMEWVDPSVLGDFYSFERAYVVRDRFGGVLRYKNLDKLNAIISKAMIRKTRKDEDVSPFLPDVQEEDVLVPMDTAGKRLYKKIAADFLAEMKKPGAKQEFNEAAYYTGEAEAAGGSRANSVYAALLALCGCPDIVFHSAMDYADSLEFRKEFRREHGRDYESPLPGSWYTYQIWCQGLLSDVRKQPKLEATWEELTSILDIHSGNKVILFSQYRYVVEWFRHHCENDGAGTIGAVVYHGGMSSLEKAKAQERFKTDPNCRVFISTEAGTYGVDLPEASHLINYDPPPNAGRRGQRNARHVRAGSAHTKVFVINMLIEDSVEVRKLRVTEAREEMASHIMDGTASRSARVPSVTEWLKAHPL